MSTPTRPDVQGMISGGRARRRRRNAMWAGGAALALAIVAGGVYAATQLGDDDTGSSGLISKQPTPRALPDDAQSITAGTYAIPTDETYVVAPYTISVPAGWDGQDGNLVGKNEGERAIVSLEPFALDKVQLADEACTGESSFGAPQTSTAGLVAGLRAQGSGPRVGNPVSATVGGLPATRIDLAYPADSPLPNCRLADEPGIEAGVLQVWTGFLVMFPAETASVYVVDLGDREQLFVTRTAHDASVADRVELQSILDSIRFQ